MIRLEICPVCKRTFNALSPAHDKDGDGICNDCDPVDDRKPDQIDRTVLAAPLSALCAALRAGRLEHRRTHADRRSAALGCLGAILAILPAAGATW